MKRSDMGPVKYFAMDNCPGEYFTCEKLSATLSKTSCADLWRRARRETDNIRMDKCRGCAIGALHAGEPLTLPSRLSARRICVRCHRQSNRFVFGTICVSCYNRQQEWVVGRNAKGTKPIKQKPLYPLVLPYLSAEREVFVEKAVMAESAEEMIVRVLKGSQGKVMFGFFKGVLFNEAGAMVSDRSYLQKLLRAHSGKAHKQSEQKTFSKCTT